MDVESRAETSTDADLLVEANFVDLLVEIAPVESVKVWSRLEGNGAKKELRGE